MTEFGLGMNEIGEIIRKVRKERGLRLEDLSDENISTATISNLERGVPSVKQDKVIYLLEKLGISMEKLPELIMGEKKQLKELEFKLDAIDSMRRMGQLDEALDELNQLDLADDHPYAPERHWLKGDCLLFKKDFKRAEREFFDAVRLCKNSTYGKKRNIEAYSFSDLSLCCYYQNDLNQALQFTDSGLDAFNPEGERQFVKYILLRNKAVYLERLGRIVEALKIVDEVWEDLPKIEQKETVFAFYWLKGELLRRSGALEDAIQYTMEGIKLASLNYDHKSVFSLWVVLGGVYIDLKDWDKAEMCFNIAMRFPKEHVNQNQFINACTKLGNLHIQQENWDKAQDILEKAIQEGKLLNSSAFLIDALTSMGRYHFVQNLRDEAVRFYEEALEISKKYDYKEKEYQCWYYLAQCWKGVDEKEFLRCTENMFMIQEKMNNKRGASVYYEVH